MRKDENRGIVTGLKELIMSRYGLFLQLINLEANDAFGTDEYYSVVKKISVLTTKENRLCSSLLDGMDDLIDVYLLSFNDFSFDLEKDNEILFNRLKSILNEVEDNIVDDDYDLDDYDEEEDYEYGYMAMAEKRLDLEFLCELQGMINNASEPEKGELIKFKYTFIFERKKVNDEIEAALYNVNNLLDIPLSLEMTDFDEDEYKNAESSVAVNMAFELSNDLLVEGFESEPGKRAYLIFLLKKLDIIHLQDLEQMNEFNAAASEDNAFCISDMSKIIRKIINNKILDGNIEANEMCEPLDDVTIDNIIALSKVEKLMLDITEDLTIKGDNAEQFKRLRTLVNLEKEMLMSINVNEYNSDRIMEVINDYVPIFLGDFSESTSFEVPLVINRLKGAISQIHGLDVEPTILEAEMHCILNNNMLDTLAFYSNLISGTCDEEKRRIYEKIYYGIWFSNYSLTDDFLITQGNVADVIVMDDKFWADFTGVSDIEYGYDKDTKLFEVGLDIINEINELNLDNVYNVFYLEFLELKLKRIYKNISTEHVMKLKFEFDSIDSSKRNKCRLLRKSINNVKKNRTGK